MNTVTVRLFLFVAVTKGLFVLTQTEQIRQPAVISASSAS